MRKSLHLCLALLLCFSLSHVAKAQSSSYAEPAASVETAPSVETALVAVDGVSTLSYDRTFFFKTALDEIKQDHEVQFLAQKLAESGMKLRVRAQLASNGWIEAQALDADGNVILSQISYGLFSGDGLVPDVKDLNQVKLDIQELVADLSTAAQN